MSLLKDRVAGRVKFVFFRGGVLHYACDFDGYVFEVPVEDTGSGQGNVPTFQAEDKGIYFMRWIRKMMEAEKTLIHVLADEDATQGALSGQDPT